MPSEYYASWSMCDFSVCKLENTEDTQLQLNLVIIIRVDGLPEGPLGRQWRH